MNTLILNAEENQIVGYRFKIYKKVDTLQTKLIYQSPHEHKTYESINFPHMENLIISNGDKIIKNFSYKATGKSVESNDFYTQREEIYRLDYDEYTLPELYKILEQLKKGNFEMLENLNILYKEEEIGSYARLLEQSFSLEKLFTYDIEPLLAFKSLCEAHMTKKEYAEKELSFQKECKIYQMHLENIPRKK
ncbi:MAG: hypothetical protein PHN72_02785 [Bacilli bacterium]|nr:hypothetical protein [Bacilli bacterium]